LEKKRPVARLCSEGKEVQLLTREKERKSRPEYRKNAVAGPTIRKRKGAHAVSRSKKGGKREL